MSFFRNLLRWRPGSGNASGTAAPTPQAAPAPIPAPMAPQPPQGSQAAPPEAAAVSTQDCVAFSLKAITDLFPQELKPALRKQPSEHVKVQIPRAVIQPQLAAGAVRITFAELRAATPEIFFHPDGAPADTKLLLPLETILRAMMPNKRDDQRQPAIPVNIPSIFAKAGAPPARPGGTASRGAEPWYSQRRPTYEAPPEAAPPVAAAPLAPAAAAVAATPVVPPAPAVPAAPAIPAAAAMPPWPKVEPAPRSPSIPSTATASAPAAIPNTPACAPPAPVPVAMPAAPPGSIAIPLALVLTAMPAEIRQALDGCDPTKEAFVIPMVEFESRMRSGKLLFNWSQLRTWCGVEASASVPEDIEIELPLATVVPIFLAARGAAPDSRKKVEVDSRIPDVFGKSNSTSPATASAPAADPTPAAAPIAPPVAAPVPIAAPAAPIAPAAPAAAAPPLRIEKAAPPAPQAVPAAAAHDPAASDPAQVVASLRALEGVTGAFLATSDGLLIAGDVPDSNDNVLAAFAPTVFSQMTKYAEMARMGPPLAIELHFKGGTVHVRKVGRLYIGVLMPHGSPLPHPDLELISTALQPQAS